MMDLENFRKELTAMTDEKLGQRQFLTSVAALLGGPDSVAAKQHEALLEEIEVRKRRSPNRWMKLRDILSQGG